MDLRNVSLDIKIGQLITAGFKGLTGESAEMIHCAHIGNVILFSRNIVSAEQTAQLTADLQQACMQANGLPAFISVDQECGSVDRFNGAITRFPGNMALAAASGSESDACQMGRMLGLELRALGVQVNFSPCVDVLSNPKNSGIGVRSYGSNPKRVAGLGAALIKGLSQSLVTGCAKHFPGSGDADVDAHHGLPVISHGMQRLTAVELAPFQYAVQNGCEMVMVGHPVIECMDPLHPASVSRMITFDLLKVKIGFSGIIITDCLEMGAVARKYGTPEAAVRAVEAGADMVCISHTHKTQLAAVKALKKAVVSGKITEERINESFVKIVKAKEKAGLFKPGAFKTDPAHIRNKEHLSFASRLYEKVPGMLGGRWFLPDAKETVVIGPVFQTGNPAEDMPRLVPDFAKATGEALGAENLRYLPDIREDEINRLTGACANYGTVILGLTETGLFSSQMELYRRLKAAGKKIMAVSMRTPFDLLAEEAPACHICLFEYTMESLQSFVRLIKAGRAP